MAQAQLVDAPKATADEGWPTDWYVRDGEGLDELRALEGKRPRNSQSINGAVIPPRWPPSKSKIIVLDFWATWCGPCMAVIPKNVEFVTKYKDKGVAIIGIHDAQKRLEDVDQVISDKGINYPVALDKTEDGNGSNHQGLCSQVLANLLCHRSQMASCAGRPSNR